MSKARDLADLGGVTTRLDQVGNSDGALSNRNMVINGDFSISQRSSSVTGATSTGYSTVDRWWHNASGGTQDMSQQSLAVGQTDLPSQFTKFFRFSSTSGNNNQGFAQKIENVELLSGTTVTVSFYAKGTNPGAGSVKLAYLQYFGSGGSANVEAEAYSITLTSSWQLFKATISLPSVSGKTIGAGNSTYVYFRQGASDTSTAAWTMDITGVQLEVGDTSTDFEHISYGDQLQKCMRYYTATKAFGVVHSCNSTGSAFAHVQFPVTMRSTPSISMTYTYGNFYVAGSARTITAFTPQNIDPKGFQHHLQGNGFVSGNAGHLDANPNFYVADAEL
tara:strand:- start:222 stop:1223 length:1002 start_codon:yes stop_codon:yes gene_type:complete